MFLWSLLFTWHPCQVVSITPEQSFYVWPDHWKAQLHICVCLTDPPGKVSMVCCHLCKCPRRRFLKDSEENLWYLSGSREFSASTGRVVFPAAGLRSGDYYSLGRELKPADHGNSCDAKFFSYQQQKGRCLKMSTTSVYLTAGWHGLCSL